MSGDWHGAREATTILIMEHLHDRDPAAASSPSGAEKLLQALELMDVGLRLKRAALARQHPHATVAELEQRFREWLLDDD